MSERWRTREEAEVSAILSVLNREAERAEQSSQRLKMSSRACMFAGDISLAAAILTERHQTHHWGREQYLYSALGIALNGISYLAKRQGREAGERAMNLWTSAAFLEIDSME